MATDFDAIDLLKNAIVQINNTGSATKLTNLLSAANGLAGSAGIPAPRPTVIAQLNVSNLPLDPAVVSTISLDPIESPLSDVMDAITNGEMARRRLLPVIAEVMSRLLYRQIQSCALETNPGSVRIPDCVFYLRILDQIKCQWGTISHLLTMAARAGAEVHEAILDSNGMHDGEGGFCYKDVPYALSGHDSVYMPSSVAAWTVCHRAGLAIQPPTGADMFTMVGREILPYGQTDMYALAIADAAAEGGQPESSSPSDSTMTSVQDSASDSVMTSVPGSASPPGTDMVPSLVSDAGSDTDNHHGTVLRHVSETATVPRLSRIMALIHTIGTLTASAIRHEMLAYQYLLTEISFLLRPSELQDITMLLRQSS